MRKSEISMHHIFMPRKNCVSLPFLTALYIYNKVKGWNEPICIAILPDHPTPVEVRTHVDEPVPFLIWHEGIAPDAVQAFDEQSCKSGCYGLLRPNQFMQTFMDIQ